VIPFPTFIRPLHTDMAYYRNPPGLQIFTMCNPADEGGESIFSDGFAVAEYMRKHHRREFDILCETKRVYRSVDFDNGWWLEGSGPIIRAIDHLDGCSLQCDSDVSSARWGTVIGIRHNDLDRLPDLPPLNISHDDEAVEKFYTNLFEAHDIWNMILAKDEFRLVIGVKAGETVVVANQRCLHGRFNFSSNPSSPRVVMGCYVSQDDLESRFRLMLSGLNTHE